MRKKLIIATTAGALTLGGLAVAVPALADTSGTGSAAVERITEALTGLVSDGSLTQEQADEVASTLTEAGIGGHGGHGGGRLDLEAAATALNMTEDELHTALEADGTSLADVAGTQGVEVDTLIDALVTAAQDDIAQAVEDGELSQEQADERLADLETRVTERVNSDAGLAHGGRGDRDGAPSTDED
jgi:polyhydroxyalkanoate synthesis regulator phasin